MTDEDALKVWREARLANNSISNPYPSAGHEAAARVIQTAFAEREATQTLEWEKLYRKEAHANGVASAKIAQLEAETEELRVQLAQTIMQQDDEWQKAKQEIARLREALEEIVNPITAMQIRADLEGKRLDGHMAVYLADNIPYLQAIAAAALKGSDQ